MKGRSGTSGVATGTRGCSLGADFALVAGARWWGEFFSLVAAVDWGVAASRGVLRPKRPAVKMAAS